MVWVILVLNVTLFSGNYCPVCHKCYADDDWDCKMVQCSVCENWVHARCEGMTSKCCDVNMFSSTMPKCKICGFGGLGFQFFLVGLLHRLHVASSYWGWFWNPFFVPCFSRLANDVTGFPWSPKLFKYGGGRSRCLLFWFCRTLKLAVAAIYYSW